jgi:hypothetical protein
MGQPEARQWEERPLGASTGRRVVGRGEASDVRLAGWRAIRVEKGSCTDGREDGRGAGDEHGGERSELSILPLERSQRGKKGRGDVGRPAPKPPVAIYCVRVVEIQFMSASHHTPPIRPASGTLLVRFHGSARSLLCCRLAPDVRQGRPGCEGRRRASRQRQRKPLAIEQAAGFWAREEVGVGQGARRLSLAVSQSC